MLSISIDIYIPTQTHTHIYLSISITPCICTHTPAWAWLSQEGPICLLLFQSHTGLVSPHGKGSLNCWWGGEGSVLLASSSLGWGIWSGRTRSRWGGCFLAPPAGEGVFLDNAQRLLLDWGVSSQPHQFLPRPSHGPARVAELLPEGYCPGGLVPAAAAVALAGSGPSKPAALQALPHQEESLLLFASPCVEQAAQQGRAGGADAQPPRRGSHAPAHLPWQQALQPPKAREEAGVPAVLRGSQVEQREPYLSWTQWGDPGKGGALCCQISPPSLLHGPAVGLHCWGWFPGVQLLRGQGGEMPFRERRPLSVCPITHLTRHAVPGRRANSTGTAPGHAGFPAPLLGRELLWHL